MRWFLALWSALWALLMPLILLYLWRRGRGDRLYFANLAQRFGHYARPMPGAVWVHAVSLGEIRSAAPLIGALLQRGETVVVTHFTPAGLRASQAAFGAEIAQGRLAAVWVPFELAFCFRGFFRAYQPKLGLVMEVEIWPRMVQAARDAGVGLYMCNAIYPRDSMVRDARLPLRPAVMRRFAGAFVKSQMQAQRFASVGVANIAVTGELRFDQPIPPAHLAASAVLRAQITRPVIAFASVTRAEEELFIAAAQQLCRSPAAPIVLFIPRAPERFGAVGQALAERGLTVVRRSACLDADLRPLALQRAQNLAQTDVILGDSLGEMYFYLGLADRVVVGGGFQPAGSHNIIEALAMQRPVLVGPHIQTIEYPASEALAAGVCLQTSAEDMARDALNWPGPPAAAIAEFLAAHSGSTQRLMAAIAPLLSGDDVGR